MVWEWALVNMERPTVSLRGKESLHCLGHYHFLKEYSAVDLVFLFSNYLTVNFVLQLHSDALSKTQLVLLELNEHNVCHFKNFYH